jgi:hypothetical protein
MTGRVQLPTSAAPTGASRRYLLVETHAPGRAPARFLDDAIHLRAEGHPVVLVLVEDGVYWGVQDGGSGSEEVLAAGGSLWVDRFSLAQRAIDEVDVVDGSCFVDMTAVAGALLSPAVRAVWH